ncbi:MAG: T9SS type A sorting domain-containing protein [Saprospiraceae bacterium]|nr:T9SS type A sorting domain-containing protein [Saprospiraceae bacterium]
MIRFLLLCILACSPLFSQGQYWEQHWVESNYEFTGSGGDAVSVNQTNCEEAFVQVTDPVGAPLPAFSPLIINPKDSNGDDITDISAFPLEIHLRARSVAPVTLGVLFRSDDGTSDFRTAILYDTIPADLEQWTDITLSFTDDDVAGFNATKLRDVWLFLDRGTENFNGDKLYIDYISLGGSPSMNLESPCTLDDPGDAPIFAEYFKGGSLSTVNTGSSAGQVTIFSLDEVCETLQLRIADPVTAPLPAFNAYIINPIDADGNDITDISSQVNVNMRVRSAEAVQIDVLFRSGEGSQEERSARKNVSIPANLEEWTDVDIEFAASELEGFNPADLRDFWLYLDRGTPNFPGNEFYIDHIVIGGVPDVTMYSPCSNEAQAQAWIENWDDGNAVVFGGAETAKLTLGQTECEAFRIEVSHPNDDPHTAFRPIVINPLSPAGSDITNISGNLQVVIRARSAAELPLGLLLRSGDGSSDFRTAILTQNVVGTLEAWSTLIYEFSEEDLGGFDPEDLVDLWIFLDRSNNNFPGNELYLDYIAIGAQPDASLNSPCGLPDFVVATEDTPEAPIIRVYPNPVEDQINISLDPDMYLRHTSRVRLYGATGELQQQQSILPGQHQISIDVSRWPAGIYFLELLTGSDRFTKAIIKH